jgi:Protein of unknown function (DUF1236)
MRRTWIRAAATGITTLAAVGLAYAQEKQDQQTPGVQQMEKGRPAQTEKEKRATEPSAGQTQGGEAQEKKPSSGMAQGQVNTNTEPGPNAQHQKAQAGQAEQPQNREREKAQTGQAAQPERAQTGQAVAPETRQGGQMQGGQAPRMGQAQPSNEAAPRPGGNAVAIGNVHISSASASQVADALMSTGRSQTVSVAINVGAPLPGELDLLALPPTVVSLVPEFQGDEYVLVNDEIVIVQPSTRVVVEVIRPGGVAEAPAEPPPAAVTLTDAQRQLLLESVRNEGLPEAPVAQLTVGETVPQDVKLTPAPSVVVAQIPMIERYRLFLAAENQVVLVDPDTRAVVDIVR